MTLLPAKIDRSVRGTVKMSGAQKPPLGGYSMGYHHLTLDDVERFCIEARMYGATPQTTVDVTHGTSGPDGLSISVPANFEMIPVIPSPGKNARLNRRLAVVAVSAVATCVLLGMAFLVVLVA